MKKGTAAEKERTVHPGSGFFDENAKDDSLPEEGSNRNEERRDWNLESFALSVWRLVEMSLHAVASNDGHSDIKHVDVESAACEDSSVQNVRSTLVPKTVFCEEPRKTGTTVSVSNSFLISIDPSLLSESRVQEGEDREPADGQHCLVIVDRCQLR